MGISSVDKPSRKRSLSVAVVLVVALAARLAALAVWSENLIDDRDGYLALADGLAHGRGLSVPGTETPTAYRPPLYPIALMPGAFFPSGFWTATLHVSLGMLSGWLTFVLASRLTSDSVSDSDERYRHVPLIAAALVAVDPILLRYTTLPMTETLATCLVTALLVALAPLPQEIPEPNRLLRSLAVGVLFGLSALCRPTVWAFAGLTGLWAIGGLWWRRVGHESEGQASRLTWWVVAMAAAVVVLPWGLRNLSAFNRPIVMTTHGGYTLLLGNNPAFYHEVVDQQWGTVWDGSHGGGQSAWVTALNREMDAEGMSGEVERDHWMSDRAWSHIREHPGAFVRACWLRFRRFWSVVPTRGSSDQSPLARGSVGAFYALVLLGALSGVVHVLRHRLSGWEPSLLMILAFTSVHLVYWTNTRMRAPIVPVIAILAAFGWCRLWRR